MTTQAGDASQRLLQGAAALGVTLTELQSMQLLAYLRLFQQWNRVYNLSAVRDEADMLTHHLLDAMALVPALRRQGAGRSLRVLDVGSGGGLPGVVLAVCCPELHIDCVDTVGKKAAFVQQVAAHLRLSNLRGVHARVEQLNADAFDVITCRAFAALPDFVRWSKHALAEGGVWVAMKGKVPEQEMAALPQEVQVFHVEPLQVPGLDAQRCLVWLRPCPKPASETAGQ
jgi:16S rRNA (guanine527-N7)-methyltransferase